MSIVLVIIGLIVGGILTGQDLINSAAIRAQIAQIEKYQTAVETFRNKYSGLPGDISDPPASNFGFQPGGSLSAERDGNGIIQGNCELTAGNTNGFEQGCGELAVFWEDLSEAGLIDATIKGYDTMGANYPAVQHTNGAGVTLSSTPTINQWIPQAKTGNGNFVYVFSNAGSNYFAVSTVTTLGWDVESTSLPGLTVQQAYNIDKKIDDSLPQSGGVMASYVNYNILGYGACIFAAGGSRGPYTLGSGPNNYCGTTTAATTTTTTTCYDNGGIIGTETYSMAQNANIQNCALSFRFQ